MSKFNFDSEFFRRVIIKSEETEKVAPLSVLVRESVDVFYDEFDYYPELTVYAPGTITIFGDHLEYVKGNLVQAAIPLGTIIVGKYLYCLKCKVVTTSQEFLGLKKSVFPIARYKKKVKPYPKWVTYIRGVLNHFPSKELRGFDAVFHSNIPVGKGCGSSAALQVGFYTFLEACFGEKSCKKKKGWACHLAEKESRPDGNSLGSWSNLTSSIAQENTCFRINCRTGEISSIAMRDINILFLLTYPKFEIERKDSDLIAKRKVELYLAAKLLGLEDIIDATEDHLNALANMEDPTREEVIAALNDLNLTENEINEFVEDLFNCPVTPDRIPEKSPSVPASPVPAEETHGRIVVVQETTDNECPVTDEEGCGKSSQPTTVSYIQRRIAELCEGREGSNPSLPERVCEEISCLGGIENLSDASGITVCGKLLRRVRHVVTENIRSLSLVDVISKLDYEEFGTKLVQSHLSLKLDYDVSCPTLDGLVQLAIDSERVYGAKMTSGGGTLTLLHRSVAEKFIKSVIEKFGNKFQFYLVFPSSGARVLNAGAKKNPKSELSSSYLTLDELIKEAIENFEATYRYKPSHGAYSPSVINIIGDFTDTLHGLTLSAAINMYTVVVGSCNGTGKIRAAATSEVTNERQKAIFSIPGTGDLRPGSTKWVKIVKGVVAHFKGDVKGFDCLIHTSIPWNACYLSKSALLMAMYSFLEELSENAPISPEQKAHQCMLAMHEFSCFLFGTSEQLVISKAKENFFTLTDSRSLKTSCIPYEDPSINLVITAVDCGAVERRSLFYSRMEECYQVAVALGRKTLRCLSMKDLKALRSPELKEKISEKQIRRAAYIITERERALKAAEALKTCDFETLGEIMVASHKSLRDDFEVVSDDIDILVSTALEVDGVFGSKINYAGPLNCTITLVKRWATDDLIDHMKKSICQDLNFYVVNSANSCSGIRVEKYLEKLPSPELVFERLFPY